MLCILIRVVVSQVYAYVKSHQTVLFKLYALLYLNYTLINMINDERKKVHRRKQEVLVTGEDDPT